jgi:2-polyprenyl-3-methyl-5-hydroxy-6-metoxy-1,4-benzoquinol methylase
MRNILVRLLGWRATILQGDTTVVDRWRWLRRQLRPGPLRTLDAGCGSGAFTLYAARIGNRCVGVSFDATQIDRARARARILGLDAATEFRVADLRALYEYAASLGRFDQVILFETIEHIRNDQKLLDDLSALLEPGGMMLLTAPYKHHRALWGERVSKHEDGGHVRWGYTHEEIRERFARAGLVVVAEESISGLVSQKLASLQFGLGRLSPRTAWLLMFPLRVLHPLDGPLTRLTGYPPLSIGVVGRKTTGA